MEVEVEVGRWRTAGRQRFSGGGGTDPGCPCGCLQGKRAVGLAQDVERVGW